MFLIVSIMLNVYFIPSYLRLEEEIRRLREETSKLVNEINMLRNQLGLIKPMLKMKGGLYVSFEPNNTAKYIYNNGMVFLTGVITVYNLSILETRPLDLILEFSLNVSNTSGIRYNYLREYSVRIEDPIEYVEVPYSIYPIIVANRSVGDEIMFVLTINVKVMWRDVEVATATTKGVLSLVIAGDLGGTSKEGGV